MCRQEVKPQVSYQLASARPAPLSSQIPHSEKVVLRGLGELSGSFTFALHLVRSRGGQLGLKGSPSSVGIMDHRFYPRSTKLRLSPRHEQTNNSKKRGGGMGGMQPSTRIDVYQSP